MAKRVVLVLLIAAVVAGGAFALDMSAGFGGNFTLDFQTYDFTDLGKALWESQGNNDPNATLAGVGFFGYFDMTYVMVSVGMSFLDFYGPYYDLGKTTQTSLDLGLYGKYPIDLGGFVLFPTVGIDYRAVIDYSTEFWGLKFSAPDSKLPDYSNLWIKFGVGADISLGETLYLRPILLYGFGLYTKEQQDIMDMPGRELILNGIANHGLDLKIALGFKF